jgi:AraC-like DNA-binding protein
MDRPYTNDPRVFGLQIADHLRVHLWAAHSTRVGLWWNEANRNRQSSYWRLYRNDRDGAYLEVSEGRFALQAGRLYFVPAGVRFNACTVGEFEQFFVHFELLGLLPLVQRELFPCPIQVPEAPTMVVLADQLTRELTSEEPVDLRLQCRVKSLIYDALASYLETVPWERLERCRQVTGALQPILPALRHIESHPFDPLTNRQLAEMCCLSEDYFIRRFRECTGKTPARYALDRRLTLAEQRLLFTDQSIEQIAEEAGFGNRYYFSRVFARRVGVPPATYRKTARV